MLKHNSFRKQQFEVKRSEHLDAAFPCSGFSNFEIVKKVNSGLPELSEAIVELNKSGGAVGPDLPDLILTPACHKTTALCASFLPADFGVEIAGTMWIVLGVSSKIRITMAFAQLSHNTHSH